ncbi:MAG: ABC transporter permease [Proteobacteria bacterium]|nr:ABC transporter permease [Pseudomonadota bacterium]MBU1706145.1 ABC transporter permease [Patescibacteria group bacterium]
MNLWDIALRNLRRRKSKAAFVLVGLTIGVSAVVVFISIAEALTQNINSKLEEYGANILIVPKTENLPMSYGGISLGGVLFEMQEIHEEELAKIGEIKNAKNVAAVGPMLLGAIEIGSRKAVLAGMDFQVASQLRPWWKIQGKLPDEEGVLAGAEAARILGLVVGKPVAVNGRSLVVSGILEATGSQDDHILFTHLVTAQSILRKEGRISLAEVAALCAGCPIEEMVRQISEILPGANVMAIKQVVEGRMETLNQFRKASYGLSAIVVLVGGLVVLVTMMGSVRERTAEIGIFRAIGFRSSHIMKIILLEAGIVSVLAGVLGYLVGLGATKVALLVFVAGGGHGSHGIALPVDPWLAGAALALAIVLGLSASYYPARLAARLDPCEALRAL